MIQPLQNLLLCSSTVIGGDCFFLTYFDAVGIGYYDHKRGNSGVSTLVIAIGIIFLAHFCYCIATEGRASLTLECFK